MDYVIICVVALLASTLTFFSGFGLGTILTPVLTLFFPVPLAIGVTAIVHLTNNLFKMFLVGNSANREIITKFGIPAIIAALLGASLLGLVSTFPTITSYSLANRIYEITLIKVIIGSIIVVFACLELSPRFQKITIDSKYLPIGGVLSGFFGGLSGHQGALRTMFLIKTGLGKEEFIATNIVLAVLVDVGRLFIYVIGFHTIHLKISSDTWPLILATTISAFIGSYLGLRLFKKVTLKMVQSLVGGLLILVGFALSIGLI